MAAVVVVTDSSADIPPPLAEELGIFVAPMAIDFRDGHFLDGRLSPPDFYRRLQETEELPPFFRRTSRRCRRAGARPSQLTERPVTLPGKIPSKVSRFRPCRCAAVRLPSPPFLTAKITLTSYMGTVHCYVTRF
jgi:Uncharacterised protein, DegV family COG1307